MSAWLNIAIALKNENVPKQCFEQSIVLSHVNRMKMKFYDNDPKNKIYGLSHKYIPHDMISDTCEDCGCCNCFGDGIAIKIYDVTKKGDVESLIICDDCIDNLGNGYVVGDGKVLIRVDKDDIIQCDHCKKQIDIQYLRNNANKTSKKNEVLISIHIHFHEHISNILNDHFPQLLNMYQNPIHIHSKWPFSAASEHVSEFHLHPLSLAYFKHSK
jgi:hypothetical protein